MFIMMMDYRIESALNYPFARGSLMMEAACTSETPVNVYLTTLQYIPEDSINIML
jgi:hypothetical protein